MNGRKSTDKYCAPILTSISDQLFKKRPKSSHFKMEKTGPGKPSEDRNDGAVNLLVSGRAIDAKQAMRFTGKFTEEEIIDILSHRKILHYIHMHHHLGYYNYYTTQARIINRERTIILTLPSNRSESYRYSGRVQHLFCVTRGR